MSLSLSFSEPVRPLLFPAATLLFLVLPSMSARAAQAFPDVPSKHYAYEAVEELVRKGTLRGGAEGKFHPDRALNRAEALAFIALPLMSEAERQEKPRSIPWKDVPRDAWYLPQAMWTLEHGILDPKSMTFSPTRSITKAEFLRMLFLAYDANILSFSEITSPLSPDVQKGDDWYYAIMRYSVSSAVILPQKNGLLTPGKTLTRGEGALLLHRFLLYREGKQVQTLLTETKRHIETTLAALQLGKIREAEEASARALLTARGAHASKPDASVVVVAVKTAESVNALVRAYRASLQSDRQKVITLAKEAWSLAEQAKKADRSASVVASQLMAYAESFAKSARGKK